MVMMIITFIDEVLIVIDRNYLLMLVFIINLPIKLFFYFNLTRSLTRRAIVQRSQSHKKVTLKLCEYQQMKLQTISFLPFCNNQTSSKQQ